MHGKRVAPVDYSSYVPRPPATAEHKVRNRTEPYIIWQSTESSPLYSSFSRNGYDAHAQLRWVRGKNEFDKQLNSARHHLSVLRRIERLQQAREYYGRHVRTGFLRSPSMDFSTLATTLTEKDEEDHTSFASTQVLWSGREATPISASSTPTLARRIIAGAAAGFRRPESSSSARSAPHNVCRATPYPSPLSLPPPVRVHRTCLVVRGQAANPAVEQLMQASSDFTLPHPPKRSSTVVATRSRRCDESLMRLIRGGVAVY
ncbi:uncharacterized protein Tco025E_03725 [Trypanosoma conorhini]|uniref:Uncharacterized protein n=1 Tax=Trypanosoma conorhini TaxID=83891 RepID=A0A422PSX4_9TRYP|nr:uncharacterized protein Tco025E_03725 [Trypanosoma conorhini]RNF20834.1 hypothetical protein Tco025E_03725 [Trypanosoma conorhini]